MRNKLLYILLFWFCISCEAFADDPPPFLGASDLPDMNAVLPPPPAFDHALFACDKTRYEWGKALRDTPRGEQAKEDAKASLHAVVKAFSPVMGIAISSKGTPKIYDLLGRTIDTVMIPIKEGKRYHQRMRPFAYFEEASLLPEQEESHNPRASYPSGHSAIGWTTALLLAEIHPEAQTEILKKGYEYGQSRVIAGYHFQSDVDASRLIVSMVLIRLHSDPEFLRALQEARDEFARAIAAPQKAPQKDQKKDKKGDGKKNKDGKKGKKAAPSLFGAAI